MDRSKKIWCKTAFIFLIPVLLLSTEGFAQKNFKCFVLKPPEQLLEGVKRIAITDFTVNTSYDQEEQPGKNKKALDKVLSTIKQIKTKNADEKRFTNSGVKIVDHITASLLEDDRGIRSVGSGFLGLKRKEGKSFQEGARTDIFTIVERNQIDRVISELQLGQTGLLDENTATQVGNMLGVDAMIMGTINVSYSDSWHKEKRTKKNKETYEVDCNKHVVNITGAIKIIKVETGQVIGSKDSKYKKEYKSCDGVAANRIPQPEAAVEEGLRKISDDFVSYFAPYFELSKLDMAKIKNKQYKNSVETAKKALEDYDLDAAYIQYTAIASEDPYDHTVLFNIGVLHEAVGNYDLALKQYEMASKLKSKEKKYRKGKKRVRKQIEFWKELNAIGVEKEEYSFEVTDEDMQEATMTRIQVKGSSSERYPILSAPDDKSEIIVRVPGEIELEFVEKSGNWYKVKLLDGRDGFISEKNAKIIK